MASRSVLISWRPRRSAGVTSRIDSAPTLSSNSSRRLGRTLTFFTPASVASSVSSVTNAEPALGRVVVEQGDGDVLRRGVAQQRGQDTRRAVTGAEDEQALATLAAAAPAALEGQPPGVAGAGHEHEGDQAGG